MDQLQTKTDLEATKAVIAKNLVMFRKQGDYTQQQIAELLNYSDKAVSKWERGEGVPDVLVLKTLADFYGVTVNDFLVEHADMPHTKPARKNLIAKRWLIAILSASLSWLVATIITVIWLFVYPSVPVAKFAYLVALPVSLVVLLVFSCIWSNLLLRGIAASLLVWSLCVLIDVVLGIPNSWLIYLVGAILQLLIVLWYLLRFFVLKDRLKRNPPDEQ